MELYSDLPDNGRFKDTKISGKINSQIAFERHDSKQNYHVECQQPLNIHQLSHGGEGGLLVIIS